jgi:heme A synthase
MDAPHRRAPAPLLGPALTCGFAVAVAVWIAWFVTHLPWLNISERVSLLVVLGVWLGGAVLAAGAAGRERAAVRGALAGVITAAIGLLLLGSKLVEPGQAGDAAAGFRPGAGLMAAGFLCAGIVIGTLGGLIGFARTAAAAPGDADWLARFAFVTVLAVAPLLFVGGLVTSTNSGMAVPDWPNTYGSNMFLYPLGPRTRPDVFLEHSHRLFGTLSGLATLVLAIWVIGAERRRWVKSLALVALATIIIQGSLGGMRVLTGSSDASHDPRLLRFLHGVLAQLTFGVVVSIAVILAPSWRVVGGSVAAPEPLLRRLKFFSTGLLHSTILQLIFGALYRHFRDDHSKWTHVAFSLVVVIFAAAAGFLGMAITGGPPGLRPILRRLGLGVLIVVMIQFTLGWITFVAGGTGQTADGPIQALLRTAHQANGALLLGLATALFLWTRRAVRLAGSANLRAADMAPA